MKQTIYAIVVTYYPSAGTLLPLLGALLAQTDQVLIVDNTEATDDRVFAMLQGNSEFPGRIRVIRLGVNRGIATALNVGITTALEGGCTHVLLSDQDSLPSPAMVAGLLRAERELTEAGKDVAAVGPVYRDQVAGAEFPFQVQEAGRLFYSRKHPTVGEPNIETLSLITSGTLINAKALARVGVMKEDFFIDHVDVEWCHRAISKGMVLVGTSHATMNHHMGDNPLRVWVFGWRNVNGYGVTRLYYRFRNFAFLLRLRYVPTAWKIRASWYWLGNFYAHVVFVPNRRESLIAMVSGFIDGLRGKMGPRS